jgi:PhnB protein
MSETGRLSGLPPEGWHTVTPRIVVHDARRLVEFVTHVFEATGDYRPDRPAVLRIGDSVIMISDAGSREPMPAFLYVYIDDVDRTHRRAIQAGATSLEEPSDLPYDRRGMVRDEWGNTWQIASPRGNTGSMSASRGRRDRLLGERGQDLRSRASDLACTGAVRAGQGPGRMSRVAERGVAPAVRR